MSVLVTDNPDRGMIPPYPKIIIGLARQGPLVPIPGFEPGNRKCEDNGIPKHFGTFWSNCFKCLLLFYFYFSDSSHKDLHVLEVDIVNTGTMAGDGG